jgi:type III pantothenate kinase
MINLVIDRGNTRIKVGLFKDRELIKKEIFNHPDELKNFIQSTESDHILVSSVNNHPAEILSWSSSKGKKIILTASLPLPVQTVYLTPETLGVDRLAAVCGAHELFPENDCLIIDSGTCINYEFLDAQGIYHGGAISPGISMRFEAMHTFTARLPLVAANENIGIVGNTTETCMQSGVMNGVLEEVRGFIQQYQTIYPHLVVIMCGGDYPFFENKLKPAIFVAPELVLIGLNRILRYHVEL